MIVGIGIDHIEISRIKKIIKKEKEKFLKRVFSEREIKYCEGKRNKYQHYAARFTAKEAVYKALSPEGKAAPKEIRWRDIEVVNNASGKPEIILHNKALSFAKKVKVSKIFLSLSHNRDSAICQAIIEANSHESLPHTLAQKLGC